MSGRYVDPWERGGAIVRPEPKPTTTCLDCDRRIAAEWERCRPATNSTARLSVSPHPRPTRDRQGLSRCIRAFPRAPITRAHRGTGAPGAVPWLPRHRAPGKAIATLGYAPIARTLGPWGGHLPDADDEATLPNPPSPEIPRLVLPRFFEREDVS